MAPDRFHVAGCSQAGGLCSCSTEWSSQRLCMAEMCLWAKTIANGTGAPLWFMYTHVPIYPQEGGCQSVIESRMWYRGGSVFLLISVVHPGYSHPTQMSILICNNKTLKYYPKARNNLSCIVLCMNTNNSKPSSQRAVVWKATWTGGRDGRSRRYWEKRGARSCC